MRKRERTRIKCRVDELPTEAREKLDRMLADVNITYQQIADEMTDDGYEISKSSIGRYASRTSSAAARLVAARERTATLIESIKDHQGLDSSAIATALIMDGVIQELATMGPEEYSEIPKTKLIDIAFKQDRNSVYKARVLKDNAQYIERLRKALLNELTEEIQHNPDLVEQIERASLTAAGKVVEECEQQREM